MSMWLDRDDQTWLKLEDELVETSPWNNLIGWAGISQIIYYTGDPLHKLIE